MPSAPMITSLFDIEDSVETFKVRDMQVGWVSTADISEFCRRYHYTQRGGNMTWRYGLWHGPVLLGVVAYNLPTRTLCESLFGPEQRESVWHMGRLALADSAPHNSESRLIGGSLRLVQRDYPSVWAVVTYAATDQGHIGYVYQATNALYTGLVVDDRGFVDPNGYRRPAYQGGARVTKKRAELLGWKPSAVGPKHRYVYVLGDRRQRKVRRARLRWPTLPYPKVDR